MDPLYQALPKVTRPSCDSVKWGQRLGHVIILFGKEGMSRRVTILDNFSVGLDSTLFSVLTFSLQCERHIKL